MTNIDHNYVESLKWAWVPHWNCFEFDIFEADRCGNHPRKQICCKSVTK